MVELFAPRRGERVIEIGPGRGVLTELLLAAGASVTAVEVDPHLVDLLSARFQHEPEFRLIKADVLKCDIALLAGGLPARVLANLPYSITGEVLVRLFAAACALTAMTLMLQREVVNRLVAPPGGRVYGSLSVLTQYFTLPRGVMTLAPGSFTPPPAVSSAVVSMPFRASREMTAALEREYPVFIRMLLAHRRRTLLNNLRAAAATGLAGAPASDPTRLLHDAGIDPARRPETLSRLEALRLFEVCRAARGSF